MSSILLLCLSGCEATSNSGTAILVSHTFLYDAIALILSRARQLEALLEKMEQQRLQEEHYFRVTQDDIDKLRKQETVGEISLIFYSM